MRGLPRRDDFTDIVLALCIVGLVAAAVGFAMLIAS